MNIVGTCANSFLNDWSTFGNTKTTLDKKGR